MSRQFDTSGGADSITFSVGNAPPDEGPITVGVLAKAFSVAGFTMWMIRGTKAGTPIWGLLTTNNSGPKLFAENDFGNGVSGLSTGWRWYVMTKASGNVAPRIHVWDLSGAWSHTDDSAGVLDGTGPIDVLLLGTAGGGSNGWRGSIAVAAAVDTAMNDAAVEAAFTLSAATLLTAVNTSTKKWMVRLNQASTATSVTDDTSGSGDQSAISGTSVDADDPPGYNYALTTPPVNGQAAQTVTATQVATAAVTRSTDAAQTVTATATAVADVQRGQTVAQTVTATGAATAVVIHNASANQTITATAAVTPEPAPAAPAHQGSWNSLLSIYRQNQADRKQFYTNPITECPLHLYPLEPGPTPGTLHCVFGGHFLDIHGNAALI